MQMSNTADIIIVGAGVNGTSLAFHLSQRGAKTLVLERRFLASGSTGRSSGLVRMYYDLEMNARLAWLSFSYFRNWSDLVGGDCGFVRTGFLHIPDPMDSESLVCNVNTHQQIGIHTSVISAYDVGRLAPALRTDDFELAAYEPESGYADPSGTAKAFMDAARARGARLLQDCRVTRIKTEGDTVVGVETTLGDFFAPVVVNAAGPWAPEIARTVGIDLPIRTARYNAMVVRRPPTIDPSYPTVIDHARRVYLRPEGRQLTLSGLPGSSILGESPDASTEHASPGFVDKAAEHLCWRIPGMEDGSLHSAYSGFDAVTVDSKPILDQAGPRGHYLMCGFNGTGFKTAPAAGNCMAALVLNGTSTEVGLSLFSWERFANGKLAQLLSSEQAFRLL
jgi:sarcosine oxidase subunit beta